MIEPAKDYAVFIISTSDPDNPGQLCPHPSEEELVTMLRAERETGTTPKRLHRARWCGGCLLMLELIKHYDSAQAGDVVEESTS